MYNFVLLDVCVVLLVFPNDTLFNYPECVSVYVLGGKETVIMVKPLLYLMRR